MDQQSQERFLFVGPDAFHSLVSTKGDHWCYSPHHSGRVVLIGVEVSGLRPIGR